MESLEYRITALENLVKGGKFEQNQPIAKLIEKQETRIEKKQNQPEEKKVEQKNVVTERETYQSQGSISKDWNHILKEFKEDGKIMLYTNLIGTQALEVNDMTVAVQFDNGITEFKKLVLEKPENKSELEKKISIACGKPMHVTFVSGEQEEARGAKINNNDITEVMQELDIPFQVIE